LEVICPGMQTSSNNRKSAPSRSQTPNELLESKGYTAPSNLLTSIADESGVLLLCLL
jgi:hypothetical protein